jgi:hypothetical protein
MSPRMVFVQGDDMVEDLSPATPYLAEIPFCQGAWMASLEV